MFERWKRGLFRPPNRHYPFRWVCLILSGYYLFFSLFGYEADLSLGQFLVGFMFVAFFVADSLPQYQRFRAGRIRVIGLICGALALPVLLAALIDRLT